LEEKVSHNSVRFKGREGWVRMREEKTTKLGEEIYMNRIEKKKRGGNQACSRFRRKRDKDEKRQTTGVSERVVQLGRGRFGVIKRAKMKFHLCCWERTGTV